ncbi:unnamed protein product [Heligmosomoides polygyrus]|uniref:Uncharacterized protein n=1 Tax=Heligmosomoides polygyrus TaxID=6339 RepID=A0A3P8DXU6_HELPZ|nr:unnamed protein product [Heligmosomoides polygyrus]
MNTIAGRRTAMQTSRISERIQHDRPHTRRSSSKCRESSSCCWALRSST